MAEYKVTVNTQGYEIYYVEAESEDEALRLWCDNEPVRSEVVVYDVESVEEAEDE